MLTIEGNQRTVEYVKRELKRVADDNFFFGVIYEHLQTSVLRIVFKDEDEALRDEQNDTGTLDNFRAYYLGDTITIFDTRYETLASLFWLTLHELLHYILNRDTMVYCAIKTLNLFSINGKPDYFSRKENYTINKQFLKQYNNSDVFHSDITEEKLCDDFATFLTGACYDRVWWRVSIRWVEASATYKEQCREQRRYEEMSHKARNRPL